MVIWLFLGVNDLCVFKMLQNKLCFLMLWRPKQQQQKEQN